MRRPTPIPPAPGQESVWDYPRPPAIHPTDKQVRVIFNGVEIINTHGAIRILETSHPPAYYFPPGDVKMEYFRPIARQTVCEFKGLASYYNIVVGDKSVPAGAWYYPSPVADYAAIKDYISLYPGKMDACYVDDEVVQAQSGDFYGGWITNDIVGPFKGDPSLNTTWW